MRVVPALAAVLIIVLAAGSGHARPGSRSLPLRPVDVQLGVRLIETTEQLRRALGVDAPQAALVMEADPGGPAATAGIAAGDAITRVADAPVGDGADVLDALRGRRAGDEVPVEWVHAGAVKTARVTLAAASGRMRMGRWSFDLPVFQGGENLRGELRRFHDDIERRLRELDRRLRRLEEDGPEPT